MMSSYSQTKMTNLRLNPSRFNQAYSRDDTLKKHLREKHGYSREAALAAAPIKRRDNCPDCKFSGGNISRHRKVCKAALRKRAEAKRPVCARKAPVSRTIDASDSDLEVETPAVEGKRILVSTTVP